MEINNIINPRKRKKKIAYLSWKVHWNKSTSLKIILYINFYTLDFNIAFDKSNQSLNNNVGLNL